MQPDTMVAEVAANMAWKKKKVQAQPPSGVVGSMKFMPKDGEPMNPLDAPNMSPKPSRKNRGVPTLKSTKFFMRMLPAFLARVRPGCMNMTSMAPSMVQMMLPSC